MTVSSMALATQADVESHYEKLKESGVDSPRSSCRDSLMLGLMNSPVEDPKRDHARLDLDEFVKSAKGVELLRELDAKPTTFKLDEHFRVSQLLEIGEGGIEQRDFQVWLIMPTSYGPKELELTSFDGGAVFLQVIDGELFLTVDYV